MPPLHVVTDDAVLARPDFGARAREVLAAGGAGLALHLRGPGTTGRRLHDLAAALLPVARGAGALLLVNDRVDVALAAGLDGVQLGGRSLPAGEARALLPGHALVGASVHDAAGAERAEAGGVDFLVVGTIFATASHPERVPAGPALLSGVGTRVRLPLIAIGGVTPGRVAEVVAAGAAGAAVLRGAWEASDPGNAVRAYLDAIERAAAEEPA